MADWSHDLIVVRGDDPVRDALDLLATTTAAWVVVVLDGRAYAFREVELTYSPALQEYRNDHSKQGTLASALGLREDQRSTTTRQRDQLPSLEGDVGARETVQRHVLLDDRGEPVAVMPEALEESSGSAPRRRTMRSPRRAPAPAARETPRMTTPPDDEAPGEASDDTASGERSSPPSGDGPAADGDEGTSPVRFPDIEADTALTAGQSVTLTVDLLRHESTRTMGGALAIGDLPVDWETLPIDVQLISNHIAFENGGKDTVTIRRNADSEAAPIRGVVSPNAAAGSVITVNAVFMHNARFCGTALRMFTEGAPPEADVASRDTTAAGIHVERNALPPDLTVHVMVPEPSAPGKLLWLMQPRDLFDELPASLEGRTDVGLSAQVFAATLFKEFAQLDRGRHERRLQGFGDRLWKKAPSEFRDTYWAMWDRYQRPLTIQFVSSEAHIPWELMRPGRDGEVQPLLAVQHPVARWIGSHRSLMRQQLPAGSLFSIVPRYRNAAARLKRAEAESAMLRDVFNATDVPATYENVMNLLESQPTDAVAFLHFAGHGTFDSASVDSSTIKLEDGSLAVDEVAREEVRLGAACRTIVFLNACEVGATGSALGTVGGWADAFIGRRFGGFIAPLWAVDDEDAGTVSRELLNGVLIDGAPIGEVLRSIRESHGAVSPTFVSYLFYGDVNARITPLRAGIPR
ncbi:hypothetical protein BH23GEM9_BH23GEM9_32130 [soil metagenome]